MNKADLLDIPVSFYRNMKSAEVVQTTVENVLLAICSPFYETQVRKIRDLKSQNKLEEANEMKCNLHAVTFCATFDSRRLSSLYHQYNRLMVIDIDKLSENETERVKGCLEDNPLVATYWKSPSGNGWKGLVALSFQHTDKKMDVVDMHHWAFIKLEEYFKKEYDISLDTSGKDITRLCFMSWSPELKIKDKFEAFSIDLDEMRAEVKSRKNGNAEKIVVQSSGEPIHWNLIDGQKQGDRTGTPYDRRMLEQIYKFLVSRNESITSTYEDWVKVAFAIAQTFHSVYGRKMFLKFCKLDGADHNEARSERLIYDAYTTQEKKCDFSTIIYLARRKGFYR